MARAARHCFGELHVTNAGQEVGVVTGRSPRIAAMKSASTCQPPRSESGIGIGLSSESWRRSAADLVSQQVVDERPLATVESHSHRVFVPDDATQPIDAARAVLLAS